MSNNWFQFKKFKIIQERAAMKVGVDSVILGSYAGFNKPRNILDVGTGTGLLAFMAEQRTNAKITAIEIDHEAYMQCLENVILNKKKESIEVLNIAFQEYYATTDLTFDHIISNPPFFISSTIPKDESVHVAKHTYKLSYSDLMTGVSKLLSPEGIFTVIIPFENKETFIKIASLKDLHVFKLLYIFPKSSKSANRVIIEFSKSKRKLFIEKLCIRNTNTNEYTIKYKQLTKDFYIDLNA